MSETKRPDEQLDKTVADSFPASDPPSTSPKPGTRKAEQIAQQEEAESMEPKGSPTSDRHAGETAAGRVEGNKPAQQDDR